ncbi:MAG TPA: hypothetical protein VFC67_24950 [Prolixibacteraceae bacterium]|nr:hypothetical protein [Prolixibacteraceae bacterium]
MKSANHHFSLSETPIIADHILCNYKRDRLYFEHYSPLFNNEFLIRFEENVNALVHLTPLQALEKEIVKKNDKIQIIINHFHPLLNITEALLQKIPDEPDFIAASLSLKQLREVLNKKCAWEIQKSCRNMVSELELLIEELIDKGFIIRILNDFHLLMQKLKDGESELAEVTHQHDMVANEYLLIDNQLEGYIETIFESTPAVFGENFSDKSEEYSIEKLMVHRQFIESESQ